MGIVKIAMIGAGTRLTYTYAPYIHKSSNQCKIISVVESKKGRRDLFAHEYDIKEENVFESIEEFLQEKKIADAVIISGNDNRHYDYAKLLLENGYHVLLETPVANTLDRLVKLKNISDKHSDKIFMASYVLRYSDFFNKIKEIVESKDLGKLISIQYNENIGYWNFAHYYTRGNFRNDSDSSPVVLNKSCSDFDIINYITGSKCKKIASFGSLKHMNNDNFKDNMGDSCFTCNVENECPYSAKKIYLKNDRYINNEVHIKPTKENLRQIIENGPYGRCVYKCDNNVVDNMVSILEFEDGVSVTFNLSAFTNESDRIIKLMFSHGELEGSFFNSIIKIKKFGHKEEILDVRYDFNNYINEDIRLIKDFINLVDKNKNINYKCSIKEAIESHIVAFASEYSRISEEVVYIKDFFEDSVYMTNEIEKYLV